MGKTHNIKDLYLNINAKQKENIKKSLEFDKENKHSQSYQFVEDFSVWLDILGEADEVYLYKHAITEYQMGLVYIVNGQYRQAFNSLRFCLEHTCFGLDLSVCELNFRKWKSGLLDVYWSTIIDKDNGIFSKPFISLFSPMFVDRSSELLSLSKCVYRECSEFVHGNYKVNMLLPTSLEFDSKLFNFWQAKASEVRFIIIVMFVIRYHDKLTEEGVKNKLEHSIMEYTSTLHEIEFLYSR